MSDYNENIEHEVYEYEEKPKRTVNEEIELAGHELIGRVKQLVAEGNVRRLIIRNAEDKVLLEIPLTAAVLGGGVTVLLAPVLAAVGGLAALVTRLKVEIVREVDDVQDEE